MCIMYTSGSDNQNPAPGRIYHWYKIISSFSDLIHESDFVGGGGGGRGEGEGVK